MNTYSAIIEKDEDWYFGYSPEVAGSNGQGRTIEECKEDLAKSIELILEDIREDYYRGLPQDAIRVTVTA